MVRKASRRIQAITAEEAEDTIHHLEEVGGANLTIAEEDFVGGAEIVVGAEAGMVVEETLKVVDGELFKKQQIQ